jgi:hypothetical protein
LFSFFCRLGLMLGLCSASLVDAACWICSICVQRFVHVGVRGYSRHTACVISLICCQQCTLYLRSSHACAVYHQQCESGCVQHPVSSPVRGSKSLQCSRCGCGQ